MNFSCISSAYTQDHCSLTAYYLVSFFKFQALCFFNGMRVGFYRGDVKLLLNDIQELKYVVYFHNIDIWP